MIIALLLIPFVILTQATENAIDFEPILRHDGFKIPGYDGVCTLIPHGCSAQSTECMTATCNVARGNVCWGQGRAHDTHCEEHMHDIGDNVVAVPGVCVEGVCVHIPEQARCQNGDLVAFRTFPSCGDVGFGKTFRFKSKHGKKAESHVVNGVVVETFGPDLASVTVTTSQTINDPGKGIATIRYLSNHYGDCIVGQSSECKISAAGTYHLMGMTIKWNPDSGNADSRETKLELENQTIELRPRFYCSTDDCRTTIQMSGSSHTPCGDTQLTCQKACKYRVSGFQTWPELNGDYVERVSGINGFSGYSKINSMMTAAKALNANEWWFDDDLSDYDTMEQTGNVKAYLPFSATQDPFNSQGFFQAFERPAHGAPIMREIQIRHKCRSSPGPCGNIEPLHSTHKFWSAAYGTVRFTPPDYQDASVKENPNDPYNIALLGDPITTENADFSVEVTFRGQMAGIVVFGSENSYVMCRLDSATQDQATGISIVKHPNTMVVNGKEHNGQLPNPENTPIRLKVTIHEGVVTCYSNGLAENSEILPRVTGTYTGSHSGRFGFATLNAAASFRILGCPSTTPIPPIPPCIPTTTTTTTTTTPSMPAVDSVSVSESSSRESESTSDSVDSDDGDTSFDNDSGDGGSSNGNNFFNFGGSGGDSDDAEAKVGDSDDGGNGGDSNDGNGSTSNSASASDSSEDPDNGPTCLPQPIIVPSSGGSGASDSGESASDSFDVEAAIGVQTQSLSHAVFEDRILYLLASIGVASSVIIMYRLFCTKEDYEVVAEPELEEL